MSKNWILVIDSGSGGKYTLQKLKDCMPNENFLYYMDKANCPYGNKSRSKLKKIIYNIVSNITSKYDVKLVVLACNTMSAATIDYLKDIFQNLPIIGIQPLINDEILKKPTLLLSTTSTKKYSCLIKSYKSNKNLFIFGFKDLAKKIDGCEADYDKLQPFLDAKLKKFRRKYLVNVILGCTHYNYIKLQIEKALKTKVDFFESSENVAQKAAEILKAIGGRNRTKKEGKLLILCSH